jgi:hypothetical protein
MGGGGGGGKGGGGSAPAPVVQYPPAKPAREPVDPDAKRASSSEVDATSQKQAALAAKKSVYATANDALGSPAASGSVYKRTLGG